MLRKKTIILFIIFIVSGTKIRAQDTIKKPFIIGSRIHYGSILPHSGSIKELANSNPWGVELNINWLNISEKSIKQCNCYSRTGIAITYFNFANPEKLGSSVNGTVYFEPLLSYKRKLYFTFRAGTGVAYVTKVYDEINNPENKFFSSHSGFILLLDLNLRYKLSNSLNMIAFGSYNHISNGGIKQPNKGMNYPTAGIGFDYNFMPVAFKPVPKTQISDKEKITLWKFEFLESLKVQAKTTEFDEKACFIYGFSVFADHRIGKHSALNAGLEWVSDGYIKEGLKRAGIEMDHRKAAFLFGHNLLFSKFNFTIQLGVYFYNPHKTMDEVYQKYMIQYKFSKMVYAGVYMKAHRHVAEIIGLNIGLAF